MKWQILDTGINSAQNNMEYDYALLKGLLSSSAPILHLYDWEGSCATYGYFQDPFSILNKDAVTTSRLDLAKRPTGGGLLFHLSDFTFSILIPSSYPSFSVNTLQNYSFINRFLAGVIEKFTKRKTSLYIPESCCKEVHCCMAVPSPYDILIDNKKVAGGAQRRNRGGFLHQGTISLDFKYESLLSNVFRYSKLAEQIQANTFPLIDCFSSKKELWKIKQELKSLLQKEIQKI